MDAEKSREKQQGAEGAVPKEGQGDKKQKQAKGEKGEGGKGEKKQKQQQQQQQQPKQKPQQQPKQKQAKQQDEKKGKKAAPPPEAPSLTVREKKELKKLKKKESAANIHPTFVRLGVQYRMRNILGGNARCLALLAALKELVNDYVPPSAKEDRDLRIEGPPPESLQRDFVDSTLKKHINYLTGCRRMCTSMGNAVNHFKACIQSLPVDMGVQKAKERLIEDLDDYMQCIITADKDIAERCLGDVDPRESEMWGSESRIKEGDVILTYGRSTAIEWVFRLAHHKSLRFEVIVVDSRPLHEGRKLATTLATLGISVTYCLFNAISTVLPRCSKVFIGASTVLNNGSVVSRMGTASLCMMAKHFSRPVLCFCETYKFADKVWLGSLTNNEEADEGELLTLLNGAPSPLAGVEKGADKLTILNLLYDVTPTEFINLIMTELGPMPPTSVPVIIRERQDKSLMG